MGKENERKHYLEIENLLFVDVGSTLYRRQPYNYIGCSRFQSFGRLGDRSGYNSFSSDSVIIFILGIQTGLLIA